MTFSSTNTVVNTNSQGASVIPFNRFSAQTTNFDLVSSLQTTLDLDAMFDMFERKLNESLEWDSLHYVNSEMAIDISRGRRARNRIYYHLSIEGSHYGDIYCTRKKQFDSAEIEAFENLLAHLIYPLRNALKYREALHAALKDPLTGVGNRSALEQVLSRELNIVSRHHSPLTLMIVDIDHFKKVNDNFGHEAGDQVLKAVAKQLQECIRGSDMLFRFGGEEFCVVLSNTNKAGAHHLAERTREAIANMACQYGDKTIKVTISVGLSDATAQDDNHDLFARADKALYLAKNSGRNQVQAM